MWVRRQAHGDIERNTEAPFRPDECSEQIVAIRFAIRVAEMHDLAVRENGRDGADVVERDAVLEAVRPACILRDVSTDRARRLARRVRCVVKTVRRGGARERHVDDARLDGREAFDRIDRENPRQAIEADEDDVVGERAARQTGAGAARHERHVRFGEQPNDGDELVARVTIPPTGGIATCKFEL